jgi:hypothetical protein
MAGKNIPMSDSDLKKYIKGKKIHLFENLKNKSISKLLPNKSKDYITILYEVVDDNDGHWISLLRYTKKGQEFLEMFDSYGMTPKELYEVNSPKKNDYLEQDDNYLSIMIKDHMMKNKSCKFVYNKKQLQSNAPNTATCGRWCIWRILSLMKRDYSLDQFIEMFSKIKKEYPKKSNDEIVSLVVH